MKKKGFTLIELLVVISIISLLSSLVLVSLSSARKQAQFTAVKEFSANIKHALGAYEIGEWNFDDALNGDCTGITNAIKDASGNANDGTCFNGVSITADGLNRKSAFFSGMSHTYISINDSASLNSPKDKITVEVWIKPPVNAALLHHNLAGIIKQTILGKEVFAFSSLLSGGLVTKQNSMYFSIAKDVNQNKFINFWLNGVNNGYSLQAVTLNLGEWNHLVGTYNGSQMVLYLNAKQLGDAVTCSGNINWLPGDLFIGTQDPNGTITNYFTGDIDEARIYNYPLTSAQVEELYAEGLKNNKAGLVVNK